MTTRRSRGDGGLFWSEARQRWIAEVTVGYTAAGKRIYRRGSGKTKTEAKAKLKEVIRDHDDGVAIAPHDFTVADAVTDWLTYGLNGRTAATVEKYTILCNGHVIPALGARKLRDLSATDVDKWLADKAKRLSTRTLRDLRACLNRSVNRAMARDKVKRNVVALCGIPAGIAGRPSKSLTLDQAKAVLKAAEESKLRAYVVVSLMTGARTEELRALRWDHVDLVGQPEANPPVPPSMQVWRSVRAGGDTKTRKSRRTLALPAGCVLALEWQKTALDRARGFAGKRWTERDVVFASSTGAELDPAGVRRALRRIVRLAGLNEKEWTPRELRHSFVSLLSDSGMSLEQIADLVGHSGTSVTEKVYRHQLRPVLLGGAQAMDKIFATEPPVAEA